MPGCCGPEGWVAQGRRRRLTMALHARTEGRKRILDAGVFAEVGGSAYALAHRAASTPGRAAACPGGGLGRGQLPGRSRVCGHRPRPPTIPPPHSRALPHRRLSALCHSKCVAHKYTDSELTVGENACIDRCVSKFFEMQALLQQMMMEGQQQR